MSSLTDYCHTVQPRVKGFSGGNGYIISIVSSLDLRNRGRIAPTLCRAETESPRAPNYRIALVSLIESHFSPSVVVCLTRGTLPERAGSVNPLSHMVD